MNSRTIKVETFGDFAAGKTLPRIRMGGKWLAEAGFHPRGQAEVELAEAQRSIVSFVRLRNSQSAARWGDPKRSTTSRVRSALRSLQPLFHLTLPSEPSS